MTPLLTRAEIRQIITETINACGVPKFDYITFSYSNRLRTTMGLAKTRFIDGAYRFHMDLSVYVHANSTRDEQIRNIKHEACHLIDSYQRRVMLLPVPGTGHGSNWKRLMAKCGARSTRCHSNPVKRNKTQKRYEAVCNCTTWEISGLRVSKMLKKGMRYTCPKCRSEVKLTDKSFMEFHRR